MKLKQNNFGASNPVLGGCFAAVGSDILTLKTSSKL